MNIIAKRILSTVLSGVVLFSVSGCSGNKGGKSVVSGIENPPENSGKYFDISYDEWHSEYLFRMASDGYTETNDPEIAKEYRENTVKYLAQERIVMYLAKEMGFSPETFTDEDAKEVESRANSDIESWYKRYEARAMSILGSGYTDQQLLDKEKELLDNFLSDIGLSMDIFTTWAVNDLIHKKFVAKASESITEQDVKDFVQKTIDDAKDKYENDLAVFEQRYTAFYVPEGTRRVQQIAVLINSTSAAEVTAYRKDGDDKKADEILNEQLAKVKFRIDEAYQKLENGEEWKKVQEEYNDEPSSNDVDFTVYPKSSTVLQIITNAAMGIEKKGSYSEIFQTDKGYFILYYKDDITMTDERLNSLNDQADTFLRDQEAYNPIQEFLEKYPYYYDYETLEIDNPNATTQEPAVS